MSIDLTAFGKPQFDLLEWLNGQLNPRHSPAEGQRNGGQTAITTGTPDLASDHRGLTSLQSQLQFLIQEVQYKHDQTVSRLTQYVPLIDKDLGALSTQIGSIRSFLLRYRDAIMRGTALDQTPSLPLAPAIPASQAESAAAVATATTSTMDPAGNSRSPSPDPCLRRLVELLTAWSDLEAQRTTIQEGQQWKTLEEQVRAWTSAGDFMSAAGRLELARRHFERMSPRTISATLPESIGADGYVLKTTDADNSDDSLTSDEDQGAGSLKKEEVEGQAKRKDLIESLTQELVNVAHEEVQAAFRQRARLVYNRFQELTGLAPVGDLHSVSPNSSALSLAEWYRVLGRIDRLHIFWESYQTLLSEPLLDFWTAVTTPSLADDSPTGSIGNPTPDALHRPTDTLGRVEHYFTALVDFVWGETEWLTTTLSGPTEVPGDPLYQLLSNLFSHIQSSLAQWVQFVAKSIADRIPDDTVWDHQYPFIVDLYHAVSNHCVTLDQILQEFTARRNHASQMSAKNLPGHFANIGYNDDDDDDDGDGRALIGGFSDWTLTEKTTVPQSPPEAKPNNSSDAVDSDILIPLLEPFRILQEQFPSIENQWLCNQIDRGFNGLLEPLAAIHPLAPSLHSTDVLAKPDYLLVRTVLEDACQRITGLPEAFKTSLNRLVRLVRGRMWATYLPIIQEAYVALRSTKLRSLIAEVNRCSALPDVTTLLAFAPWNPRRDDRSKAGPHAPRYHHHPSPSHQQIEIGFNVLRLWQTFVVGLPQLEDYIRQAFLQEAPDVRGLLDPVESTPRNDDDDATPHSTVSLPDRALEGIGSDIERGGLVQFIRNTDATPAFTAPESLLRRNASSVAHLGWTSFTPLWVAMMVPLFAPLAQFTALDDWHQDRSAAASVSTMNVLIPSFSLSPSSPSTQVGEYLLTLPQLCDTYLNDAGHCELLATLVDPWLMALGQATLESRPTAAEIKSVAEHGPLEPFFSDFPFIVDATAPASTTALPKEDLLTQRISALTQGALAIYTHQVMLRLRSPLTASGRSQMVTDFNYLSNIVQAMGIEPIPVFQHLSEIVGCPNPEESCESVSPPLSGPSLPNRFLTWLDKAKSTSTATADRPADLGLGYLQFVLGLTTKDISDRIIELISPSSSEPSPTNSNKSSANG